MSVGELYAVLTLRGEAYTAGLAKAEVSANHFGGKATAAFANVAKKIVELGAVVGLVALGIAAEGLKLADKQDRAMALIDSAYGASAAAVEKWTEKNAVALGVTSQNLDQNLSKWGVYAKGIGMTTAQAAKAGQDLAERAAKISAVTGDSFDDVFAKLQKGVQGATRGLKSYGVAVDPVVLRNEALRLGLIHGNEALDLNAKAIATQSLIMQQTTPYVDAFGKVQDKAGFQIKQIGVTMDETMVAIGQAVAPIAAKILPGFVAGVQAASEWVIANLPTIIGIFQTGFGIIGDTVSAVYAIMKPYWDFLIGVITEVAGLISDWSTAFTGDMHEMASQGNKWGVVLGNVMKVVGAAIDALKVIFNDLAGRFQWFVDNVWPTVSNALGDLANAVLPALGAALQFLKDNWDIIFPALVIMLLTVVVPAFIAWASAAAAAALATIVALAPVLIPIAAVGLAVVAIGLIWKTFHKQIVDIIVNVSDTLRKVFGSIGDFLGGVWNGIVGAFKGGINVVIGLINGLIRFLDGIQIHIPEIGVGPVHTPKFDWNGLNIHQIPYLASGARGFPGGYAMVGENGPEIVNLPRGSDVYANGTGPGGLPPISFGDIIGVQQSDVEQAVKRGLRRAAFDLALAGK